jgi:hypothetical protein
MSTRAAAVAAATAAVTLTAAPAALAANAVYGGSTKAGEALVLQADAKFRTLKSAVIAWEARCDGGRLFADAGALTPAAAEAGFAVGPRDLAMTRNARGRFAGTQTVVYDLGDHAGRVTVQLSGKLSAGKASGKLAADVTIVDKQTGAPADACRTGTVAWSATRSAGRVYGGRTSQEQPIVVRLDARLKKVTDVLLSWESSTCSPAEAYVRFGERFTNFPVRTNRFGNAFQQPFSTDDGGRITYAYDLAGKLSRKAASGTFHVNVTRTDAGGATVLSCDSGRVTWKGVTG